jgi:5-methyltetrahydrofolate--homocysteine methyltransferase
MNLESLKTGVIKGKSADVERLTKEALNSGIKPQEILKNALIPAMGIVGNKMKNNEFFIPEVLIAAKAMKSSMVILKPLLADKDFGSEGKVLLGTVKGDLHDIGKNLVMMMFEGAGFKVVDLGTDVSPEKFVNAVKSENPDIVGMSALLTTTMPSIKKTLEALKEAGLRNKVKVLVGGAPITQEYANEVGADGYASDAPSAVDKAKQLLH